MAVVRAAALPRQLRSRSFLLSQLLLSETKLGCGAKSTWKRRFASQVELHQPSLVAFPHLPPNRLTTSLATSSSSSSSSASFPPPAGSRKLSSFPSGAEAASGPAPPPSTPPPSGPVPSSNLGEHEAPSSQPSSSKNLGEHEVPSRQPLPSQSASQGSEDSTPMTAGSDGREDEGPGSGEGPSTEKKSKKRSRQAQQEETDSAAVADDQVETPAKKTKKTKKKKKNKKIAANNNDETMAPTSEAQSSDTAQSEAAEAPALTGSDGGPAQKRKKSKREQREAAATGPEPSQTLGAVEVSEVTAASPSEAPSTIDGPAPAVSVSASASADAAPNAPEGPSRSADPGLDRPSSAPPTDSDSLASQPRPRNSPRSEETDSPRASNIRPQRRRRVPPVARLQWSSDEKPQTVTSYIDNWIALKDRHMKIAEIKSEQASARAAAFGSVGTEAARVEHPNAAVAEESTTTTTASGAVDGSSDSMDTSSLSPTAAANTTTTTAADTADTRSPASSPPSATPGTDVSLAHIYHPANPFQLSWATLSVAKMTAMDDVLTKPQQEFLVGEICSDGLRWGMAPISVVCFNLHTWPYHHVDRVANRMAELLLQTKEVMTKKSMNMILHGVGNLAHFQPARNLLAAVLPRLEDVTDELTSKELASALRSFSNGRPSEERAQVIAFIMQKIAAMEKPLGLEDMAACMAAAEQDPGLSTQLIKQFTKHILARDSQAMVPPKPNDIGSLFVLVRSRNDSPELRAFFGALAPLIDQATARWTPEAIGKVLLGLQNMPVCPEVNQVYCVLKKPLEEACNVSEPSTPAEPPTAPPTAAPTATATAAESSSSPDGSETTTAAPATSSPDQGGTTTTTTVVAASGPTAGATTDAAVPTPNPSRFSAMKLGQAVRGLRGPTEEARPLWRLLSSEIERCREPFDVQTMLALASAAKRMGTTSFSSTKVLGIVEPQARAVITSNGSWKDAESRRSTIKLQKLMRSLKGEEEAESGASAASEPVGERLDTGAATEATAGAAAAAAAATTTPAPSPPAQAQVQVQVQAAPKVSSNIGAMGGTVPEPLSEALPPGWSAHRCDDKVYYHHPAVGSQWKRPNNSNLKLPPGWEAHIGSDGRVFFYHELHGSFWELPPV